MHSKTLLKSPSQRVEVFAAKLASNAEAMEAVLSELEAQRQVLSDLSSKHDDLVKERSEIQKLHADAVAELEGQIDALQAEYDAYVIST